MVRYGAGALVTAAAIAWMYPLSAPAATADTTSAAKATVPPAPEPAFSFDSMPGRLPKDVVPERYEIAPRTSRR